MATITVVNNVSLDCVMQGPARPDKDTRGGFAHGGWGAANTDSVMAAEMGKRMGKPGALLLTSLELLDSVVTTTGVVIATYQRAP